MEMIHLDQVLDEFFLVMGHLVMTARLVEQALEQIGRIPALGSYHEGGDVGQPALQGNHHQIAHQANVLPAGKLPVHRHVEIDLAQFVLQSLQSGKLPLDGTDGFEVLGEFFLILMSQVALERAGIFQNQVRNISVSAPLIRLEKPAVSEQRIAHGRRDVLGAVPGNIVELDGFLVVLVTVATELQGFERRPSSDLFRNDMIQGSRLWIGRMLHAERAGTGEKTRCALGMHVGPRLKGPVQARNEGYLFLEPLKRFHGGGQLERMLALGQVGLGLVGREVIPVEKGSDSILLARKEGAPDHTNGHVVKGQPLSDFFGRSGGQAFHPLAGRESSHPIPA